MGFLESLRISKQFELLCALHGATPHGLPANNSKSLDSIVTGLRDTGIDPDLTDPRLWTVRRAAEDSGAVG